MSSASPGRQGGKGGSEDPLKLPLNGLRLIEASAGTGKTFTLAGLFLRLLIERRMAVRDILVMTFTRPATQELRERLRQWLSRAAVLAADPDAAGGTAEDRVIGELLEAADDGGEGLARRLADAAGRMDEATITTIHGFSRTAAAEHAFDSGVAFDRGEQGDDEVLLQEACYDYWRERVIGGRQPLLAHLWPDPKKCHQELKPALHRLHVRLAGPEPEAIERTLREARQAWSRARGDFQAWLAQVVESGGLYGGRKLDNRLKTAADVAALFEELDACIEAGPLAHDLLDPLGSDSLANQLKGNAKQAFEAGPGTKAVDAVREAVPLFRLGAIREAVAEIHARVGRVKTERRLFSYDDMIRTLHDAVTDPDGGPALAAALHQRWPCALVDEFQDTDPLQYRILHAIYGAGGGTLILIGDPKQAIYGFRGGDVFAYLQAVRDADQAYALETNRRSTRDVLDALNTLFTRRKSAFVLPKVAFHPVDADPDQGRGGLEVEGEEQPALTVWQPEVDDGLLNADTAEATLQTRCVAEVQRLLDPRTRATLRQGDDPRPLRPRDVGVLVSTNAQASRMQQALARAGVPAACAHRASVYTSEQAPQLLRLLRACATPADARAVRTALTGELFGARLGDLLALNDDEQLWQQRYEVFLEAHRRWAEHGVLPTLEPLIQAAAPRLLELADGERRMTNWLQLAERLQAAEPDAFGMAGLIQWLETRIREAGEEEDEEAQLRLENEADLVQITTIHRAKGLEYPVVMVPFAHRIGSTGKPHKAPYFFHDDDYQALLDPREDPPEEDTPARAIREHRAEGVRLLYVALTRARQAVYMGWGPVNGAYGGALAWLLHGKESGKESGEESGEGLEKHDWPTSEQQARPWFTPETVTERTEALAAAASKTIAVEPVAGDAGATRRLDPPAPPAGTARSDLPSSPAPWAVFSFSGLVRDDTSAPAERAGADDEARLPAHPDSGEPAEGTLPAEALEGLSGTAFGSAVHELLEQAILRSWPAPGEAPDAEQEGRVRAGLLRHGIAPDGVGDRVGAVVELIARTLHTPLPEIGPLAARSAGSLRVEMPFTLRLGGERAERVAALLQEAGYASALPPRQHGRILRGLMQGYIDLVVEADGRFWVLDYKTNRLGELADYAPQRLQDAVRAGHYDLQYLIYLTALHRYLRQRLPGYTPEEHLGGVQYLFVRGLTGGADGHGVFHRRPDPALIRALDARLDAAPARDAEGATQ